MEYGVKNFKDKINKSLDYPSDIKKSSTFGQYIFDVINPARRNPSPTQPRLPEIPLRKESSKQGIKYYINIDLARFRGTGSFGVPGSNQLLEDAVRANNGYGNIVNLLRNK